MAAVGAQFWLDTGMQLPNHTEAAVETSVVLFLTYIVALLV